MGRPTTTIWKNNAGQRVEVGGKLDNEIDKGKISVQREDGVIKIEFDAEGERKVKGQGPGGADNGRYVGNGVGS